MLLKQAKAVKMGRKQTRDYTDDEIDLSIGWLKDEVRESQVAAVMTFTHNNCRHWLAGALQAAYRRDKLVVKERDSIPLPKPAHYCRKHKVAYDCCCIKCKGKD